MRILEDSRRSYRTSIANDQAGRVNDEAVDACSRCRCQPQTVLRSINAPRPST